MKQTKDGTDTKKEEEGQKETEEGAMQKAAVAAKDRDCADLRHPGDEEGHCSLPGEEPDSVGKEQALRAILLARLQPTTDK